MDSLLYVKKQYLQKSKYGSEYCSVISSPTFLSTVLLNTFENSQLWNWGININIIILPNRLSKIFFPFYFRFCENHCIHFTEILDG